MSDLDVKELWLKVDVSSDDAIRTVENRTPVGYRNSDLRLRLGIFDGDTVHTLANIDSITVEVRDHSNPNAAAYFTVTVDDPDFGTITDLAAFTAKTESHATVDITDTQMNLELGGKERNFLIYVKAVTTDAEAKNLTLGETTFKVKESGTSGPGGANYYTSEEADARFMQKTPANGSWRIKTSGDEQYFQMYNPTTGLWHTMYPDGAADSVHTVWDQTGEA